MDIITTKQIIINKMVENRDSFGNALVSIYINANGEVAMRENAGDNHLFIRGC